MEVSLAAANALVTINKVLTDTVSLIGNIIAIVFYIVFSPFICLLMLIYPEPAEPEELEELVRDPFEQSEESKKITIRF